MIDKRFSDSVCGLDTAIAPMFMLLKFLEQIGFIKTEIKAKAEL